MLLKSLTNSLILTFRSFQIWHLVIFACSLRVCNCNSSHLNTMQEEIHPVQDGRTYNEGFLAGGSPFEHVNETEFHFTAFNKSFEIQLEKNNLLVSSNFRVIYHSPKGGMHSKKVKVNDCYYHGRLAGQPKSFVVFRTCDGLQGFIRNDKGEDFILETFTSQRVSKHLLIRRNNSANEFVKTCTAKGMNNKTEYHRRKKPKVIQQNAASNDQNKYIEMVLVMDHRVYKRFPSAYLTRAFSIINYVDQIYKLINTRVAFTNLIVWKAKDMITVSSSGTSSLSELQKYAQEAVFKNFRADSVVLLTGINLSGSLVGVARLGSMCSRNSAAVVEDQGHSDPYVSANIVAHEVGHTLGFEHSDACHCSGTCVMTSYAPLQLATAWADCIKNSYAKLLSEGSLTCLYDYPDKHFGDSKCGNGFLEKGEKCDCGTESECRKSGEDKCCNPKTCELQTTAKCANGPCCENCQPKSKGFKCRYSYDDECDLPEFCTGTSTQCPPNSYVMDGTPCDGGTGYCFGGTCKSHNTQCKRMWGPNGVQGEDWCYNSNHDKPSQWANCGSTASKYVACELEDKLCGKLQCRGENLPRVPKVGPSGKKAYKVIIGGKLSCVRAYIPVQKEEEDPSMASAGVMCGNNFMCNSDRKCVNISTMSWIKKCSTKCLNGGVCNNNGNCHCTSKYACPNCEKPGFGGSVDSGQGCEVDNSLSATVIVLLVLLLGVFVGVGLLVWKRKQVEERWKKYKAQRKLVARADTFVIKDNNKSSKPKKKGDKKGKTTTDDEPPNYTSVVESKRPSHYMKQKPMPSPNLPLQNSRKISFKENETLPRSIVEKEHRKKPERPPPSPLLGPQKPLNKTNKEQPMTSSIPLKKSIGSNSKDDQPKTLQELPQVKIKIPKSPNLPDQKVTSSDARSRFTENKDSAKTSPSELISKTKNLIVKNRDDHHSPKVVADDNIVCVNTSAVSKINAFNDMDKRAGNITHTYPTKQPKVKLKDEEKKSALPATELNKKATKPVKITFGTINAAPIIEREKVTDGYCSLTRRTLATSKERSSEPSHDGNIASDRKAYNSDLPMNKRSTPLNNNVNSQKQNEEQREKLGRGRIETNRHAVMNDNKDNNRRDATRQVDRDPAHKSARVGKLAQIEMYNKMDEQAGNKANSSNNDVGNYKNLERDVKKGSF